MARARAVDVDKLVAQLTFKNGIQALRHQVAELVRFAITASSGKVQVTRACKQCGKIMRLGGGSSDGAVSRQYCSARCKVRLWRQKVK